MNDTVKVILGRGIGALVGALTGWGASRGLTAISAESAQEVTRFATDAAMLAGYGVAHRLVKAKAVGAKE